MLILRRIISDLALKVSVMASVTVSLGGLGFVSALYIIALRRRLMSKPSMFFKSVWFSAALLWRPGGTRPHTRAAQ